MSNFTVEVTRKYSSYIEFGSLNCVPDITAPSIIRLTLSPRDIAHVGRVGGDMNIILKNGDDILLPGYFDFSGFSHLERKKNDLQFIDPKGDTWWGEFIEEGNIFLLLSDLANS